MSWNKTTLTFADLALLYILNDHFETTRTAPSKNTLMDNLWNEVMDNWGAMDAGYSQPVTSSQRFEVAIRALRRLDFLEGSGKFLLTAKGRLFVNKLPKDWQEWPVEIPIRGNVLLQSEALYMED